MYVAALLIAQAKNVVIMAVVVRVVLVLFLVMFVAVQFVVLLISDIVQLSVLVILRLVAIVQLCPADR